MGYRFSSSRRPQLVLECADEALIRVGWDYQYEHEHGMTASFCEHLTGGSDLSAWRGPEEWVHSPRQDGTTNQCDWTNQSGYVCRRQIGHDGSHSSNENIVQTANPMPIKFENVRFSEHVHVVDHQWRDESLPKKGTATNLFGIWLGGYVPADQIESTTQWLWDREGPSFIRGGVEAAWYDSSMALWLVKNSEAHQRLEFAIRNGTAVFGLTPRIPKDGRSRTEPYISTSIEFAYSVLG